MAGTRSWNESDRTDGPFDDIVDRIRMTFADVEVTRLTVTHESDDDNVFWVRHGGRELQIDTGARGQPPFTVEGQGPGSRLDTSDPIEASDQAVRVLAEG